MQSTAFVVRIVVRIVAEHKLVSESLRSLFAAPLPSTKDLWYSGEVLSRQSITARVILLVKACKSASATTLRREAAPIFIAELRCRDSV